MIKRALALMIALVLGLCANYSIVLAEKAEFVKNGGFELLNADNTPQNWKVLGGENLWSVSKDAKAGVNAICFKSDSENISLSQTISNISGGSEYTFTAYLKSLKINGSGAQVKFEFYNGDAAIETVVKENYTAISKNYEAKVITFTAPKEATKANILIRLLGGGEIYWDEVSLKGEAASAVTASENAEFIKNPSFEDKNADGTPESWKLIGGTIGVNTEISKDANSDSSALRFYSESENLTASETVTNLVGGTEYIFTAYLKALKINGSGAQIKLEFYNGDTPIETVVKQNYTELSKQYKPLVITFTAPEGATKANVLIRLLGGGDILWDDISLKGQRSASDITAPETTAPPAGNQNNPVIMGVEEGKTEEILTGRPNLINNGGFELDNVEGFGPWGWEAVGTGVNWKNNAYVSWNSTNVHSGSKSIKIENSDPEQNPWAAQTVDVDPGAEYQVSAYIYSDVPSTSSTSTGFITIKLEFYNGTKSVGEANLGSVAGTDGKWIPVAHSFPVPATANKVRILLRQRKVGCVYFDDVALCNVVEAPRLSIKTDQVFYYSDLEDDGVATISLNTYVYPELSGQPITARLKYGDTVIKEIRDVTSPDNSIEFKYDLALLTNKNTPYTIEGACGEFSETYLVYKYDRPANLGADGIYRVSGKEINPFFAYRYRDWMYESCTPIGLNVAQIAMDASLINDREKQVQYVKGQLDKAAQSGVMCLVALYLNGEAAGGANNYANTEYIVSALREHPALYGWMSMDEPYNNMSNPEIDLRNSYIAIRNNDPYHPVYLCEATSRWVDAVKYCDILCIDPYPGNHDDPEKFAADRVAAALEAIDYKKPVYSLLQAIKFQEYFPTGDEMRNMIWQSYIAGASAVGFYKLDDAIDDTKTDLMDTEVWPYIVSFGQLEREDAYRAYVKNEYPIFNEYRGKDDMWYSSYVKNGALYMVVLNRNDQAKTVTVPLTGYNGLTVGEYTAEIVNGAPAKSFGGNGVLYAELPVSGAVLYKITPSDSSVLNNLKTTGFKDLYNYPWAREQIISMFDNGFLNALGATGYGASRNITRADFAYFLVNTLGLTASAADNFSDVNVNAYYAKALATGKALGILKGVGDNSYNPDAEISRQDLMVICARGMRVKKALDEGNAEEILSGFADRTSIADYAALDIAAMVKANIIKGNADGTINPLGNTTRAEAAVIMSRIYQWLANP